MLHTVIRIPSRGLVTTVSSKGQVTIPVRVRRHLGVDSNDKVEFAIEPTGEVKVIHARYPDITSLQGAAGSLKKQMTWKEMKQIAHKDRLKNKYGA